MSQHAARCPYCVNVVQLQPTFWERIGMRKGRRQCMVCRRVFEAHDAETMGAAYGRLVERFIGELRALADALPLLTDQAIERALIRRAQWTAQFVRSMYKKPQSEAYLKKITDAAMSVPTNSAILLALNAYASGRDWRPVLSKVDNPVLYVISTTSKDQAEALKEKVPSARNQP